ncbi:MAG: hypothetical protein ABWY00_05590 [Dongiaceae bacterium]
MPRTVKSLCLALLVLLPATQAFAADPAIPKTQPLIAAEIIALLDGKTFAFTAYDVPLTGTSTWDSKSKTVTGAYNFSGAMGMYTAEWTLEGDKSCTKAPNQERTCETIYKYENGYMAVNDQGKVHAVSTLK